MIVSCGDLPESLLYAEFLVLGVTRFPDVSPTFDLASTFLWLLSFASMVVFELEASIFERLEATDAMDVFFLFLLLAPLVTRDSLLRLLAIVVVGLLMPSLTVAVGIDLPFSAAQNGDRPFPVGVNCGHSASLFVLGVSNSTE